MAEDEKAGWPGVLACRAACMCQWMTQCCATRQGAKRDGDGLAAAAAETLIRRYRCALRDVLEAVLESADAVRCSVCGSFSCWAHTVCLLRTSPDKGAICLSCREEAEDKLPLVKQLLAAQGLIDSGSPSDATEGWQ